MGTYTSKLVNHTDVDYSYCFHYHPDWEGIVKSGLLHSQDSMTFDQRPILTTIYVKEGNCPASKCRNCPDLERRYNGIFEPTFEISRLADGNIKLECSEGGYQPVYTPTLILYHYTDSESASKIAKSGYIKQSDRNGPNQDAAFGQGVYGTKLEPGKYSVSMIANNNYNGETSLPAKKMGENKFDVAVEIRVPANNVSPNKDKNRDVYVHYGNVSTKDVVGFFAKRDNDSYNSYVFGN